MPIDDREAKIYYQSKLEEVGDLYFYFQFLVAGLVIIEAIEFNKKRDLLTFLILLSTVIVTMTRIFAYRLRKRNWSIFMLHLEMFYMLNIFKFTLFAYLSCK